MSRVHEALRRAAEAGHGQPSHQTESAESVHPKLSIVSSDEAAFRSPWNIGQGQAPSPVQGQEPARRVDKGGDLSEPVVVAASVKGFARLWRERLAMGPEGNSMLIEQFRRLAGTLHQAQASSGIKLIMVTSATPDDGKTLTAVNLALVLSGSYRRRVLLVDADLRRPSIPDVVDLSDDAGLSEALKARAEQKLALVQLTPTLTLLPAGNPIPDPIGVLTSPRMRRILEEASSRFDWVILDAPPVGQLADASLLAEMVQGTLFVVRAGKTQHVHIEKAIETIGRERILGVVLNAIEKMPYQGYEGYYGVGNKGAQPSPRSDGA